MPESVMIDIWTVPSGRQEEMTEGLRAAFEQFRLIDGFIGAGVLANYDGTKVASYVRMRSAADLQSAAENDEVRERLRALEAIGSSHADAYERTCVIAPPMDSGPIEVNLGAFL